jgi:hypothetical protein
VSNYLRSRHRRQARGTRWTTLAEKFQQADAPRRTHYEAAGDAQPSAGAEVQPLTHRAARGKR